MQLWSVWSFAALVLLLWTTVATYLHDDSVQTLRNAQVNVANLSRAIAEHLAGTMQRGGRVYRDSVSPPLRGTSAG